MTPIEKFITEQLIDVNTELDALSLALAEDSIRKRDNPTVGELTGDEPPLSKELNIRMLQLTWKIELLKGISR